MVRKHLTFRRVHRQGHSVQTMILCSPPAASCSPQPDRGASHIMGMGLSWCVQGGTQSRGVGQGYPWWLPALSPPWLPSGGSFSWWRW